jgi:two-component system, NarL family, invasion response regulator UvrY
MKAFRFTLADDDDRFLFIMHHLLSQNFPGSSVASFSNAEDALHHIGNTGEDILVTDHAMGSMTGTQLIEELRKEKFKIPIIMVSGNKEAEKEALTAGATEFLHKDSVMDRLVERVRSYVHI